MIMAATRAPVGPITAASMKVAQIPKPGGEFQIVDREMPDPGPGHCGVCGSDALTKETYPLEKAAEAYARMMSGKAEFRVVLTM